MEVDVAKAGECFTPDHHQFVLYVVPPRPECAPGETEQQTICHHPIVFRVDNTGHIWTRLKESSCRPCHLALFVIRGNGGIFPSAKKKRVFSSFLFVIIEHNNSAHLMIMVSMYNSTRYTIS